MSAIRRFPTLLRFSPVAPVSTLGAKFGARSFLAKPFVPKARDNQLLLGCVSYDPAVGSIWGMMQDYFVGAGLPMDYVLFTNYEQQVRALMDGHIDIAWNGPIAHVMSQQIAEARGLGPLASFGMRDCDRDFVSVVAVRKAAGITKAADLAGKAVMTGASDSPQGHLVPLHWLQTTKGAKPASVEAFDVDMGKHGDTAAGEVKAIEALASDSSAPGALLSKMMWDRGIAGQLPTVDAAKLAANAELLTGAENTVPLFDHCQFDALPSLAPWKRDGFVEALFKMDMANPAHTEVMKLEGISKEWMPNREDGYEPIRAALKANGWKAN